VAAVTVAGSDAESGVANVVAAGMFVVLPQATLAKTRIKVIQKIEQGFVIRFYILKSVLTIVHGFNRTHG
jgi:hypothetical protein